MNKDVWIITTLYLLIGIWAIYGVINQHKVTDRIYHYCASEHDSTKDYYECVDMQNIKYKATGHTDFALQENTHLEVKVK